MPMTTLVTGGRGFVGRHLVDQLLADGERVITYNRDYSVDPRDGVVAVLGELFDIPRLTETLRSYDVDRIIHTAGQSHPALSIELPVTTFAANADGTLAVYEAARMTGVRRIVFFSSECALGNITEPGPVTEDVKPAPTTVYGVTKVAGELLGSAYNSLYGMEIVSLRITEVYGPGLWMPSLLGDMIRAGLRGETFTLESGGDHGFQFVHVEDVATAARLASTTTNLTQQAYFVSGGDRMTVLETAELLDEVPAGRPLRHRPGLPARLGSAGPVRPDPLHPRPRLSCRHGSWRRGCRTQIEWIRSTEQL